MDLYKKAIATGFSALLLSLAAPCISGERTVDGADIEYTFLKECKDIVNNADAAYGEFVCGDVAGYQVKVSEQNPIYFNVLLLKDNKKISSDFAVVTNDNPVEPGHAIEWHLYDNKPKFMIFRLSWGTKDKPFEMKQYLVVNLVTENRICVIDKVVVDEVNDANEVARELIAEKYRGILACPDI